ncbi:unnamed protein product [Fraxinus pennsylvanica]|uniref:NB-ARC domain-containing protein n=1 Tax=Fraxinus pennsylvanica TaxID=56036 RepID=A0AAD2E8L6_9LAMI|nr:unnamed protein product [Fraxinus pennsylvanica]
MAAKEDPALKKRLENLSEEETANLTIQLCSYRQVLGEDSCPHGLEEAGKMITQNCKGLPLSLVVIGGNLFHNQQDKRSLGVREAEKNQGNTNVNIFAQMIDDAGNLQEIKNLQTHEDSEDT